LKKSNSRGEFSVSFANANSREEDGEREVLMEGRSNKENEEGGDWNRRFKEVLEKNRSKLLLPGNFITREGSDSNPEDRRPDEQWEEIEKMYDSISNTIPSHIPHKIWQAPLSEWVKTRIAAANASRINRKKSKVHAQPNICSLLFLS
jgi:hypothetical protein